MLLGHSRKYAKLLGASYRNINNKHDLTPTDRATTSSSNSDPFANSDRDNDGIPDDVNESDQSSTSASNPNKN